MPTRLNLNGFEVEIKYLKTLGEGERLCGQFRVPNIVEIALAEHHSKAELLATLNHELLHAVFSRCGISHLFTPEVEECIVRAIENHMAELLRHNTKCWLESKFVDIQKDKN